MLKITVVFSVVILSVVSGVPLKKEAVVMPAPFVQAIVEATKGCVPNSINLSELFAMVREGKWNDDPEFKIFVGCAFIASGFATSDGRVEVDKALLLFDGKEEAKKVIIECAKNEDGPTPEDNLFNFYKCFQLKSPYTLNLKF